MVGSLGIYGRLSAYLTPYNPVDVAVQIPSLLRNWDSYYAEHKIPPQFPITDMTDYLPPNQELITLADQWKSDARGKYGDPVKLKFATGEEFMQSVTHDPNTRFPQVHGEWPNVWAYIHGPTHLETISAGREASWDLVAAEKFWALRTLTSGGSERYPTETFDQAWMAQMRNKTGPHFCSRSCWLPGRAVMAWETGISRRVITLFNSPSRLLTATGRAIIV